MPTLTYREALRAAMADEMARDDSVVILGEDIGVYGGTHLITDGLLDRFGPKRVMDTPIAEGGFTGAAIGMAMLGMRPIVEMMTWNFSFQAADQLIQNAAKIRYFSGGQVSVPLVVRGPNGGGVQLSAQHTHSLEGFYGHFPGFKVVAPATPYDVKGMMLTAIRDPNPVLFLEAGALYGTKGDVPEGDYSVRSMRRGSSPRSARPTARSWCRSSGATSASRVRSPRSSRSRHSTISTPQWSASAARRSRHPTPGTSNSPPSPARSRSARRSIACCIRSSP